ncbi:MAG: hypothetical protein Q9162_001328 [Coniocarpon cinnabarinum]
MCFELLKQTIDYLATAIRASSLEDKQEEQLLDSFETTARSYSNNASTITAADGDPEYLWYSKVASEANLQGMSLENSLSRLGHFELGRIERPGPYGQTAGLQGWLDEMFLWSVRVWVRKMLGDPDIAIRGPYIGGPYIKGPY